MNPKREIITNGAKAVSGSQIVEIGKAKDLDKPRLTPAPDPLSTIGYAAHGSDVDTVVIDGKIMMENRKAITLKEEQIIEEARIHYPQVAKRGELDIKPRWPVL